LRVTGTLAVDGYNASGDEAGTAPEDRSFRPDVQGMRAIAVLLVVLFHAGLPGFRGGYVGVDVFFVISGFVITGILLRERAASGTISIRAFYGRRARRIIPAATLVLVATVAAAYLALNRFAAHATGVDGVWTSVFLANAHFAADSANYLASTRPPSPLQNYWSLAVEEQFYLVYPALFLCLARFGRQRSMRRRIGAFLVVAIVASFTLSVLQTSSDQAVAYFSPLTRTWELALGGLIAVATGILRRTPSIAAMVASWTGLVMILVAASLFSQSTPYPGSAVALPVVGTALVLIGGVARPTMGAERVLSNRSLQFLGLLSYSLYLWHWPILAIATQRSASGSLPVPMRLLLVAISLGLALATFRLLEDPVRHLRFLVSRRWSSAALGLVLVGVGVVASSTVADASTTSDPNIDVAAGNRCQEPSAALVSSLRASFGTNSDQSLSAATHKTQTVLVVGDSAACTLLPGLEAVAPRYGMSIENGAVIGCGVVSGETAPVYEFGVDVTAYTRNCEQTAITVEDRAVRKHAPDIVIWYSNWERKPLVAHHDVLTPGSSAWAHLLTTRMSDRVERFAQMGARTVLLDPPPFVVRLGATPDPSFGQLDALDRRFASQYRNEVRHLDLSSFVCPGGEPCPYAVRGIVYRGEGEHYSPVASLSVAQWLIPAVIKATTP
jgi:peptidoglycan/LPS O-acetylase OafA/YrhL